VASVREDEERALRAAAAEQAEECQALARAAQRAAEAGSPLRLWMIEDERAGKGGTAAVAAPSYAGEVEYRRAEGFVHGVGCEVHASRGQKWAECAADLGHPVALAWCRLRLARPFVMTAVMRCSGRVLTAPWCRLSGWNSQPMRKVSAPRCSPRSTPNISQRLRHCWAPRRQSAGAEAFKAEAAAGHVGAMFQLALCLTAAQGLPRDAAAGRSWAAKASEAGHVAATAMLGELLLDAAEVPRPPRHRPHLPPVRIRLSSYWPHC
jgi:TPR repeat protein